ncbi:MAG: M20 metallopeptidase family protein [Oscillospiraceae bacterium]|jgi:amidohydrolase
MNCKEIDEYIYNILEDIIAFRRTIHKYPEIGLQERETTERIKAKLLEYGIESQYILDGIGLTFSIQGAKEGERIALRADIDALPMEEETEEIFKSVHKGLMHACGHDINTSIVLGAAIVLNKFRDQLCGSVKFIFQSGEETLIGAQKAIDAGIMEGEKLKCMFAFHAKSDIPVGKIGIRAGNAMAASDRIRITVLGKGGHAAYPHKTVDPIIIAAGIINSLQALVARERAPYDPLVITISMIHGGTAFNITPDSVVMDGTVRSFNPELRAALPNMITRMARRLAQSYNGDCEVEYTLGVPAMRSEPWLYSEVKQVVTDCLGADRIVELPEPSMGSEDFAVFAQFAPVMQISVGARDERPNTQYPLHNAKLIFNEGAIRSGIQAACSIAFFLTLKKDKLN